MDNVDELLNDLFKPRVTLRQLFEERLHEIGIAATAALDIIKISHRTLNGILDGTQKTVDYTNFFKLSDFLQIPKEEVLRLYLNELRSHYHITSSSSPEKIKFIKENFDLAVLKKSGFINDISDFDEIEHRINSLLGFKSIFEYKRPVAKPAFSSGKVKPKNELTRDLWLNVAIETFKEIDNPHEYDRQALINFFPEIRWYSINVEIGLTNVIRQLFKFGVTVIYQSPLNSLHLRGATLSVNKKPCIVLTDYKGFYPTLWFALIHELFHVIFDWDEIQVNKYHLSNNNSEHLTIIEKENEANNFAREYLFSREKTKQASKYINDEQAIKSIAKLNDIHHSFIYVFNALDKGSRYFWSLAQSNNPKINPIVSKIENEWRNPKPLNDHVNGLKHKLFQL